jgi:hypothetical protein
MKESTRKKIRNAVLGFVGLTVVVLAFLMAFGWIPFPDFLIDPVVVASFLFVLLIAVVGYKFYNAHSQSIPDFSRKTEQQLTDKEAYKLLQYELTQNRFIRIGEMHDRGAEIVGPEDQDDNVRLYKMTFDRVNVSEKVGVVIDLEQDLNVDTNSKDSLRKAAPKIENIKVIRGKKVDDFDEEMEDAVSSLGRSLDQTITTTKYDEEGNVDEKKTVPASLMQSSPQLPSGNGVDEEVEK